jgi:hypothetical protein
LVSEAVDELEDELPKWDASDAMVGHMRRWHATMLAALTIIESMGNEIHRLEDEVSVLRSGKDI